MILFDLDDTLYKEIDFLKSAYREISCCLEIEHNSNEIFRLMTMWYENGENVFDNLIRTYAISKSKEELLNLYRTHQPSIELSEEVKNTLQQLMYKDTPLGIITDGRSITQRNKIEALQLKHFIPEKHLLISEEFGSEKPSSLNYEYFQHLYDLHEFIYVGDNVKKDFITPNQLGWTSVCLLDDGMNIHKQDFSLPSVYIPHYVVTEIKELLSFV